MPLSRGRPVLLTRSRCRWYRDEVNSVWASPTENATGRRFEGKVAFVTGGASGLGRAAAQRFAREGARVVVADLDGGGAEAVAAALPDAMAVRVDTADGAAVDRSFEAALDAFGAIDALFNNAGIVGEQMPLHSTTDEAWRRVMAVNGDGAFHVLRAGVRAMLAGRGGAIVNTSSSTGLAGKPNMTPYTFSKAGLVGLTRAAAIEYAAHGIRVNAVAPTAVMTELVAGHIARAPDPDAMRRLLETQTPIPGMPTPEDVAAVVAFLASDDARWITGHTLPIDGGFHAK
jgi:NAD(P)-dependent dehydrogenase (short-subunit alcohol dehydrogenase family)